MKLEHLKVYLRNAKSRSIRDNIPFNLVMQDLIDIAVDECPIFKTPFVWGGAKMGKGKMRLSTPTLDRILPELGYVKGNVAFLSYRANRIKDNGTMQEHYDIADWIWNNIHAKKNTTAPVPTGHYSKSEEHTKHGTVLASGTREDGYDLDHYQRTISGEDSDYRTQTRGGDSVAHRNRKVEPSRELKSREDNGDSVPEVGSTEFTGRRVFD